MSWFKCAEKRPLHENAENPALDPRILIFHTMSGYLGGTEETFKGSNLSSHFGVGGPWDGSKLDGVAYQWMDTHVEAYAQYSGNHVGVSIETSDGGKDGVPWSPKQLDKLVEITVEFCRETGAPCRLVGSPSEKGIGYHEQFPEWNRNGHVCPGAVREKQLREEIIPRAHAILTGGKPAPKPTPGPGPQPQPQPQPSGRPAPGHGSEYPGAPLRNGSFGQAVTEFQQQLSRRGWRISVDGAFGPATEAVVRRFQADKGLTVDGIVGRQTWDAAFHSPVTA